MRILSVFILLSLCGCSTLPELQNPSVLNTTTESQSYYYCEHCPEISKLDNQVYQPLEPDKPVIESKPVITSQPLIIINRSAQNVKQTKPKRSSKKLHHKFKQFNHKHQCIQWSK